MVRLVEALHLQRKLGTYLLRTPFFVASNAPASRVLAGGGVWMGVARGDEWRDEQPLTRCTPHKRGLLRR